MKHEAGIAILTCFTISLIFALIGRSREHIANKNFLNIRIKTNIEEIEFKQIIKENNIPQCPNSSDKEKENYNIKIPVKEFVAPNKIIHNDFVSMLQGNTYPNINIYIPAKMFNFNINKDTTLNIDMKVQIAGIVKQARTICYVNKLSDTSCYMYGNKQLLFTDFNLSPPVKFFGLVKVSNEIDIAFGFVFVKKGNSIKI